MHNTTHDTTHITGRSAACSRKSSFQRRFGAKAESNRFQYKPATAGEAAHRYSEQVRIKQVRIKYLQAKLAADGRDFHWQPQITSELEACKRLLRGREYVLNTNGGA
jgi:hypothetical protein